MATIRFLLNLALPVLLVSTPAPYAFAQAAKIDPLQRELEITAADSQGLRSHMERVRSMDEKVFAKTDVSPAKARTMSSEALIGQTLRAQLYVTYLLYDKPAIGIYRASLTAPSLRELCRRNDLGAAFAAAYRHLQLDPAKDPRYMANGGPMKLAAMDMLVEYPPVRRKLAGHEREVILAMAEGYANAQRVNARSKPGKSPYGVIGWNVHAAEQLLEQANPSLKIDLSKYKTTDEAMKAVVNRAMTLF